MNEAFLPSPVSATGAFLVSCAHPRPTRYLHGYAFVGADLVVGDEGYRKYLASGGRDIVPGDDGAFLVVSRGTTGETIGADFSGYQKLFLYRAGRRWAASNSIMVLVRFAVKHGWPITIDEAHLASFQIIGSFGNQFTSLHTSVEEIRVVPATSQIRLRNGLAEIVPRANPVADVSSYEGGFREFLRLTLSRLTTLLTSDEVLIRSDLTGGRDSRTVLSMLIAASKKSGTLSRIAFGSSPTSESDYPIAQTISNGLGLRLNDPTAKDRSTRLSRPASYSRWKDMCLGAYMPIYFPANNPDPSTIALDGVGGEGHRHFYPDQPIKDFLEFRRKYFSNRPELFDRFRQDVLDDIASLRIPQDRSLHPLILHYRHFRERGHGGRNAQYGRTQASPLGSPVLRAATAFMNFEQMESGQVLADIMLNCAPELAEFPFDKPHKEITHEHRSNALVVSDLFDGVHEGSVYLPAHPTQRAESPDDGRRQLDLLNDDFRANLDAARSLELFSAAYINKAETAIDTALSVGRLGHAIDGCAPAHIILAGELARAAKGN